MIDLAWLDRELHDARLELHTLVREGNAVTISGTVDESGGGSLGFPKSRYAIQLSVLEVAEVSVEDEQKVGVILVESVTFDENAGVLQFESSIPGRLVIRTREPVVSVHRGDEPIAERHWGRWRTVRL